MLLYYLSKIWVKMCGQILGDERDRKGDRQQERERGGGERGGRKRERERELNREIERGEGEEVYRGAPGDRTRVRW